MNVALDWRWGVPIALLAGIGCYVAYEEFTIDSSEPDRLAQALNLKPGLTVAEIGAGKGRMTVEIARRLGPGGDLLATEMERSKRDAVERRAAKAGLSNVTAIEAGEFETNLPPNCCHAIFMRHVYHHFAKPADIGASLFRALKPGGRIAIVDTDGNLWFLPRPKGVPENRGGHGMPLAVLLEELKRAGSQILPSLCQAG